MIQKPKPNCRIKSQSWRDLSQKLMVSTLLKSKATRLKLGSSKSQLKNSKLNSKSKRRLLRKKSRKTALQESYRLSSIMLATSVKQMNSK